MFNKTKGNLTKKITPHLELNNVDCIENQLIFGFDGKLVDAQLSEVYHLLISGYSGSGKTELIQSILLSLMQNTTPDELSVTVIAPRKSEYYSFSKLPFCQNGIIADIVEVMAFMEYQTRQIEYRFEKFHELSVYLDKRIKDIEAYNRNVLLNKGRISRDEKDFPIMERQVVVFDDYAEFFFQDKKIEEKVSRILSIGRGAGCHLFLSIQRPSGDLLSATIKANFMNRICLGTFDEAGSQIAIGTGGAESLKKGEALIKLTSEDMKKIEIVKYETKNKEDFIEDLVESYSSYSSGETNWKEQGVTEGYLDWVMDDSFLNSIDRKVEKRVRRNLAGW